MTRTPAFTASLHRLDQHQQRREKGVPTLSVPAGPQALTTVLWRDWTRGGKRESILIRLEDRDPVRQAAGEWLSRPWTPDRLIDYLSPGMDMPSHRIRELLKGDSCQERTNIAVQMISISPSRPVEMVARRVLEGAGVGNDRELVQGLALIEGRFAPGLLFLSSEAREEEARALTDLIELCPGVPVGWAIPSPDCAGFMEQVPCSRAGTLCREGLVVLEQDPVEGMGREPLLGQEDVRVLHDAAAAVQRAAEQGELDEVLEHAEKARSAAEAFLFRYLESLPGTAGMFELNGTLAADWGPHGMAEVDLLCRSRRVAVEIDGYHHFCDPDGYRRDRQKDVLLQQHGFVVLRFLADDVVARLESIVDTILKVLKWRGYNDYGREARHE